MAISILPEGRCDAVVIEDRDSYVSYIGTRETLIHRGICTSKRFPKGEKQYKAGYYPETSGYWAWEISYIPSGLWEFRRHRRTDERERLLQSKEAFRRFAVDRVEELAKTWFKFMPGLYSDKSPFNFDAANMDALVSRLTQEVLEFTRTARVVTPRAPVELKLVR